MKHVESLIIKRQSFPLSVRNPPGVYGKPVSLDPIIAFPYISDNLFYVFLEYNYTLYQCKLNQAQQLTESLKAWVAAEIADLSFPSKD